MLFQKQIFEHQMFRLNCESLFSLNYKLYASVADLWKGVDIGLLYYTSYCYTLLPFTYYID